MTERVVRLAIYREPFVWWKIGNRIRVNNTPELAKERLLAIRIARPRNVTAA